jgi:hypothetical protein
MLRWDFLQLGATSFLLMILIVLLIFGFGVAGPERLGS